MNSSQNLGILFVLLASLFYASYGVWTVLIGDFLGGYTASALRSVIVVGILFAIALLLKKTEPINWKDNGYKIIGMIVASTLVWGPLYWSILEIGIGMVLTVNYVAIVIGMLLFGYLLAGEQITKIKVISTLVGLVGISLVFVPTIQGVVALLPMLAAVIAGLAIGATTVLAKQLSYNTTQSALVLWVTSILANIPGALLLQESIPAFNFEIQWLYLVLFAIASVLSSWFLLAGMKHIDAGWAGILGLSEIVFAILFGYLFFNERIGWVPLCGVAVIIAASAIPYVIKRGT